LLTCYGLQGPTYRALIPKARERFDGRVERPGWLLKPAKKILNLMNL
jgi:hypothetical protein